MVEYFGRGPAPFGWEKPGMKIIGWLLVIGILVSYAPVFHTDECPEGNHSGNTKMDCGVPFHCSMIVDIVVSEISRLPFNGLLIAARMRAVRDGLVNPIFHPPEYLNPYFIPRG